MPMIPICNPPMDCCMKWPFMALTFSAMHLQQSLFQLKFLQNPSGTIMVLRFPQMQLVQVLLGQFVPQVLAAADSTISRRSKQNFRMFVLSISETLLLQKRNSDDLFIPRMFEKTKMPWRLRRYLHANFHKTQLIIYMSLSAPIKPRPLIDRFLFMISRTTFVINYNDNVEYKGQGHHAFCIIFLSRLAVLVEMFNLELIWLSWSMGLKVFSLLLSFLISLILLSQNCVLLFLNSLSSCISRSISFFTLFEVSTVLLAWAAKGLWTSVRYSDSQSWEL